MGKIYQLLPHFEVKEESDRKKKRKKCNRKSDK